MFFLDPCWPAPDTPIATPVFLCENGPTLVAAPGEDDVHDIDPPVARSVTWAFPLEEIVIDGSTVTSSSQRPAKNDQMTSCISIARINSLCQFPSPAPRYMAYIANACVVMALIAVGGLVMDCIVIVHSGIAHTACSSMHLPRLVSNPCPES